MRGKINNYGIIQKQSFVETKNARIGIIYSFQVDLFGKLKCTILATNALNTFFIFKHILKIFYFVFEKINK